jgi:hypothetical protein
METSERLNFARRYFRKHAGELGAGADAELCVDVRQVTRDRALAEEERGGDLTVRSPLGDEFGDPLLGRCQPLLPSAAADASELGLGSLDPGRGTELLESFERLGDRITSPALLPGATANHAQSEESTGLSIKIAELVVTGVRTVE